MFVSEITHFLANTYQVRRLEMDATQTFGLGLDRAPSLRSIQSAEFDVVRIPAVLPRRARLRMVEDALTDVSAAVMVLWPGIDPASLAMLSRVARSRGIPFAVLLVRVDGTTALNSIAPRDFDGARVIISGDESDTAVLRGIAPVVRVHPALDLVPRSAKGVNVVVVFVPPDGVDVLRSVVTAFDAIPEAWADNYRLHIITRLPSDSVRHIVDASFYRESIELTHAVLGDDEITRVCSQAAVVMIADPIYESRAYQTSADASLPVVLMTSAIVPDVPKGYPGTLVASSNRPVSIHVAMTHALRLAHVAIPNYGSWRSLLDELAIDVAASMVPLVGLGTSA